MRAREQKDADPKRTLAELRELRDEVRRFQPGFAEERLQLIERITREINRIQEGAP
jgi:hypothetical protein